MTSTQPTQHGTDSPITLDEIRGRATISVEDYGRLLNIGRGGAYSAVKRGEAPGVVRVGKRILISVPALLRMLGEDSTLDPIRLDVQRKHSGPLPGHA